MRAVVRIVVLKHYRVVRIARNQYVNPPHDGSGENSGDSFRKGCLLAVNLGNDADTTGAVYGQIAGAYYGVEGIPKAWRDKLANRILIESFADRLCLH
jgi:hypothetical protein